MIGRISGTLLEKNPPQVLIDCQGVGYELLVPMSSFYNLPALGETTTLLTQLIVREDAHTLYGFENAAERAAFRELVKISGVGPRTALSILSGLSVGDLGSAITNQEVGRLMKIPGIGKKTAERLLLELKGKMGSEFEPTGSTLSNGGSRNDIVQALLALGYSEKEAASGLKLLPTDIGISDGIKLALKNLAR